MIEHVRRVALSSESFTSLPKGKARSAVLKGLKMYGHEIADWGLKPEQIEHNVHVKIETLRLRERINAEKGLSQEQKRQAYSAISRTLGGAMVKRNGGDGDGREMKDLQQDFQDAMEQIGSDYPGIIEDARHQ